MKLKDLKRVKIKEGIGFSTFLRGCNPLCPDCHRDQVLNQSTFSGQK